MSVSRTQLLSRKRDLLAAVHVLERDHRDGSIDEGAYRAAVERYEAEAARILAQLDELPAGGGEARSRRPAPEGARTIQRAFVVGAAGLILATIVFLLLAATHLRSGNETVTGNGGGPIATAVPLAAIRSAQALVRRDPRSVNALLDLGNAYLNGGDLASADRSYLAAARVAPSDPEPRVLHAMALGMGGRPAQARSVLRAVERAHPVYARAWLLDGLYAPHGQRGYRYAIRAWKRFLALQPSGPMAVSVRHWVAAAERSLSRPAAKKP